MLTDEMAGHLKSLRKGVKTQLRRLRRNQHKAAVLEAAAGKTTNLWRAVNSLCPGQARTLGDTCTYQGQQHAGADEVSAALTAKMVDSHTYRPTDPRFDQGFHGRVRASIPAILAEEGSSDMTTPFTPTDLDRVLNKLVGRASKSPGPDGVRYWMLTQSGTPFRALLLWLFNLMWDWECMPTAWGHSHIRHLYKNKGSKFDLQKYRPISLISCLGKAYTMMWLPKLEAVLRPPLTCRQSRVDMSRTAVQ